MKTKSTQSNLYKFALLLVSMFILNTSLKSQCTSNFSYTINANGNVNFQSTSTGTSATTNYYWSFNNNTYAYTPNTVCNFTTNGIYTVCLFLSDSSNNCTSSHCDSLVISNVTNTSSCNANFSYSVGAGGNVSFYNTSTGTSSNTAYYWNFNNSSSASGPNTATTFTNYYNYVCLTIVDSMSSCYSTFCDSIIVPSNPCNTNVSFSMVQDTTQTFTWWAVANYPQNVTNAVWTWGDNSSSTGLYPSHSYSASGFYNICVTISVSCAGTASFCSNSYINKSSESTAIHLVNVIGNTNSTPTGIKITEPDQFTDTRLYPNPAQDKVYLSLKTSQINDITVSIFEVTGRLMLEKKMKLDSGTNEIEFETSNLSKGLYFLNITNGTSKKTIRLIKD